MQATSRDWLNLIITATPIPDFAAMTVQVSLSPDMFNPTADWYASEHTADGLRLMIGPGTQLDGGPGQLQPGSWHAWGRIVSMGDGTLPVFYIGAFSIEGGTDLAPMPPVTIGQAALDAALAAYAPATVVVGSDAIQGALWSGPQASYSASPSPRTFVGSISSTGENVVFTFDHLLNKVTRTVLAVTSPDDHSPTVPVASASLRPVGFYYLHNANRKIYVRVGTVPGDFRHMSPVVELSPPNPSDIAATVTYVQAIPVPQVSNAYQDFLVITRLAWHWFIGTVRIDQATGAVSMANAWQDLITFNIDAAVTGGDQGYVTLSPRSDGKFNLMACAHPTAELAVDRNVYFGIIDPVTGDVAGRGNFVTGAGLPLRRTALEVAYTRLANTGVRGFKVGGWQNPALGICDWSTSPGIGPATYRLLTQDVAPAVSGLSMTTSGFVSSANRAAYNPTSLDVRVLIVPTSTRPAAAGEMASKWSTTGANRAFRFILNTDGTLALSFSVDGTAISTRTSTLTVPASVGAGWGCRVDYDGATGTAKFYTTVDTGATWTQLGADVTGTAGNVATTTASLQVGRTSGSPVSLAGIYQRFTLRPLGGSPAADIDFSRGIPNGSTVGTSVRDYLTLQWALQANTVIIARTWSGVSLGLTGAPVGYDDDIKYVGGVDVPAVDGLAYVAREAAGTWSVDKAVQLTSGWTLTTLVTDAVNKLFRPTSILGGGPFECAVSRVAEYGEDYTDYASDLLMVSAA